MNAEQIAKLKELAQKAIDNGPGNWPFHSAAFKAHITPAAVLELIALAERTTSPVSQMTDEQIEETAWLHIDPGRQLDWTNPENRGATAVQRANFRAGLRSGMAAAAPHAQAPAEQQESIDTPEFRNLLQDARAEPESNAKQSRLIAHIDAHTAAAVEKARLDGYNKGANDVQAISEPIINRTVERAERAEAALAQRVDLSKLTRYGAGIVDQQHGVVGLLPKNVGRAVLLSDVEQLLTSLREGK